MINKNFNKEQLASQIKMIITMEVFLNITIGSTNRRSLEGQYMMQNSNIRYNVVASKVVTLATTAN